MIALGRTSSCFLIAPSLSAQITFRASDLPGQMGVDLWWAQVGGSGRGVRSLLGQSGGPQRRDFSYAAAAGEDVHRMDVIGLLGSLSFPALSGAKARARTAQRRGNLKQRGVALAVDLGDEQVYPVAMTTGLRGGSQKGLTDDAARGVLRYPATVTVEAAARPDDELVFSLSPHALPTGVPGEVYHPGVGDWHAGGAKILFWLQPNRNDLIEATTKRRQTPEHETGTDDRGDKRIESRNE